MSEAADPTEVSDTHPPGDLLGGAAWSVAPARPGAVTHPDALGALFEWYPASVPGTAAGALHDAWVPDADGRDYDGSDWWFTCELASPGGRYDLVFDGLATVADVFVDDHLVGHSENMFRALELVVDLEAGTHRLAVRCHALSEALAAKRPRPRWKTYLVTHQNLRWLRTSLLGRIPGWAAVPACVGPFRPVRCTPVTAREPRDVHVRARVDGEGGVVDVRCRLPRTTALQDVTGLSAGGKEGTVSVRKGPDGIWVSGQVRLEHVERWWPHTHGPQPLYDVAICVAGEDRHLGRVGFRTISVKREGGAFSLRVNDVAVFCRGATWFPPDPVRPGSDAAATRRSLELARGAHMNMVRVPGTALYEDRAFFDACDELGLLVWHDCMFAFMDPPQDEAFMAEVEAELTEVLSGFSSHPSLSVVCGSQEVEEVAAMNGLAPERFTLPLLDKTIPRLVERLLGDTPYVTSNPTGGALPFDMDSGVCQYFGVGGYQRPVEDARRSGVRFAAECLAFATPPEAPVVDAHLGGPTAAGHEPGWKRGLHHDSGRSWDMEDVRDFYVQKTFGVDPLRQRYEDPARALDLGRATNAKLMAAVFSEWRRPDSSCDGGLVLALRDLRLGPGWGLLDALGQPKAPYYSLKRTFSPLGLVVTDEGLNGLHCHVVNDTAEDFSGRLVIELYARGEVLIDEGSRPVEVPARGAGTVSSGTVLEGFRDITYAYRFTPPAHDAVVVRMEDHDGGTLSEVVHLPLGEDRALEQDVGLEAVARPVGEGRVELQVTTRRLAQWVVVEVPGYVAEDSWFHLAPGASRVVQLEPSGPAKARVRGRVRCLNSLAEARVHVEVAGA